jgi:hypothetical protein
MTDRDLTVEIINHLIYRAMPVSAVHSASLHIKLLLSHHEMSSLLKEKYGFSIVDAIKYRSDFITHPEFFMKVRMEGITTIGLYHFFCIDGRWDYKYHNDDRFYNFPECVTAFE